MKEKELETQREKEESTIEDRMEINYLPITVNGNTEGLGSK